MILKRVIKGWLMIALVISILLPSTYFAQTAYADMQPHPEKPLDKNNLEKPMSVQNVERLNNGVKLDLGKQEAYIRVLSSDTAKVSLLNKGDKEENTVGIAKTDWPTSKFKVNKSNKKIVITTNSLTIDIKQKPFGIKFLDKNGKTINEDANQGMGYENGKPYVFKKTDKSENFYGIGEKTDGLNKRGKEEAVWHQDPFPYEAKYGYSSVPFFIGLNDKKAYGILFDTTWRSYYNFAKESDDYYYFYADSGKLTYYFINGPKMKDVINRFTDLTGKMQMPPEWALGFQQSSWGYHQNDVEQVAKEYRDKKIPLDGLMLDIEWMDDYKNFTWGSNFPDPNGMNKTLKDLGLHYTTIIDPAIRVPDPGQPEYAPYTEGTQKDLWVKNPDGSNFLGKVWPWGVPSKSVFPNFLKKDTRDWWAQQHKAMFDKGADGVWNDMNEPVNFSEEDHWTLPLDRIFEADDGSKYTHEEVHNIYPFLEDQATNEAFKRLKPNTRPFVLTRSLYTGAQRYTTATWTGDNHSNWDHLKMSISQDANVGLTGFPFVGNDIGGFSKNKELGEECTPELFARWVEVGSFLPLSRDHYNNDGKSPSTTESYMQRQEPWQFGKQVEDISRKYINMRYELMPYLYNAFKSAHETGNLILQPLVYRFQDDANTHNTEDQFMFGNSIMIAPVLTQGATSRNVYLPDGAKWIDYWTGAEYKGGQTISKQADLGTLPIYVKKDSIIPSRDDVQQHTGEKPLTNLTLDTYLDHKATYSYYQDDGISEDYIKGQYNLTDIKVGKIGRTTVFSADQKINRYHSDLKSYTLKLHDAKDPKLVIGGLKKYTKVSNLKDLDEKSRGYYFDSAEKILYVKIPVSGHTKVIIH
ncbi:glycoside hydrolase family 31 protein [Sporolactobacillus shoreicorticis]|uniref:Glycoside hydrolase family 31 protein n=1 Tax=Sporolactobacillus shoreicorticis TaxID=1923877 RepID=A0ABW5S6Q0_9BACL|nr:glycoside hydrolase family 31 protein [Sporolactobacillus shoreicorticis]MCO7125605.1 glycoside hydrolase family 31 protein [Sporolactobacillus shoreicorticis]